MKLEIAGMRFGNLVAIEPTSERTKCRGIKWLCKCDCGNYTTVNAASLVRGNTRSCGCLKKVVCKEVNTKHGKSKTKLYDVYLSIIDRCYNDRSYPYKNYGGRGIHVCDKWKNDRESFFKWAYDNGYSEGLTIDRIDNDGDYSPDNCRFVSRKIQNNNRRGNHLVVIDGETLTVSEACEKYGVNYPRVLSRLKYGWEAEEAIKFSLDGRTKNAKAIRNK